MLVPSFHPLCLILKLLSYVRLVRSIHQLCLSNSSTSSICLFNLPSEKGRFPQPMITFLWFLFWVLVLSWKLSSWESLFHLAKISSIYGVADSHEAWFVFWWFVTSKADARIPPWQHQECEDYWLLFCEEHGECSRIGRHMIMEAYKALLAVRRYIAGKVPSTDILGITIISSEICKVEEGYWTLGWRRMPWSYYSWDFGYQGGRPKLPAVNSGMRGYGRGNQAVLNMDEYRRNAQVEKDSSKWTPGLK